jgi:hypothetical protein
MDFIMDFIGEKLIKDHWNVDQIKEYLEIEISEIEGSLDKIKHNQNRIEKLKLRSLSSDQLEQLKNDTRFLRSYRKHEEEDLRLLRMLKLETPDILKKMKSLKSDKVIQPIIWLNGEESLRQFLENLKSAGLIENRETNEIIQEHFDVDGKKPTYKESQPIVWRETKVLLAHLINGLERSKSVEFKNIWKDLSPHFLWNGKKPTGLRQSAYNNPHPNNIDKIETIINELQELK